MKPNRRAFSSFLGLDFISSEEDQSSEVKPDGDDTNGKDVDDVHVAQMNIYCQECPRA